MGVPTCCTTTYCPEAGSENLAREKEGGGERERQTDRDRQTQRDTEREMDTMRMKQNLGERQGVVGHHENEARFRRKTRSTGRRCRRKRKHNRSMR